MFVGRAGKHNDWERVCGTPRPGRRVPGFYYFSIVKGTKKKLFVMIIHLEKGIPAVVGQGKERNGL